MCPTGAGSFSGNKSVGLKSAFEILDADRDGKISRDDLRVFYADKLARDEDDVIGSMMTVADSNRDGFVEYDEFEKVVAGGRRKRRDEKNAVMVEVFRAMDRDGDGKVGHDDLKNYLGWAGFQANDDDIKAMIRLGGADDNGGGVSFDSLIKILAL